MAPAYYFLIISFLNSVILGFVIIPKIIMISHRHQLYDMPNERKIHERPIPRLGGVAFFPVITITIAILTGTRYFLGYDIITLPERTVLIEFLFLLCGELMLFILGVKDDLVGVSYKWKFAVQIICGILLASTGLWLHDGFGILGVCHIRARFGYPLAVFLVVYIINAFNLIDGLDGLASGLACISLGILGNIFIVERQLIYALVAFSTLGVILSFGFYNVFGNQKKGNKIFMGDTGTLTIGLIISFLTLRIFLTDSICNHNGIYAIQALSSIAIPLLDVIRVFTFRIIHHKNPFMPDCNHIHHQLLKVGLQKNIVTFIIILLAILYLILNNILINKYNITTIILIDVYLYFMFHFSIKAVLKRKKKIF